MKSRLHQFSHVILMPYIETSRTRIHQIFFKLLIRTTSIVTKPCYYYNYLQSTKLHNTKSKLSFPQYSFRCIMSDSLTTMRVKEKIKSFCTYGKLNLSAFTVHKGSEYEFLILITDSF